MRVAICMPVQEYVPGEVFGQHCSTMIEAMKYVQSRPGYDPEKGDGIVLISPNSVSPHDRARYVCAEEALRQKADYLFFMDDDTVTPAGGFEKLMETLIQRNVQAVSGLYLRRGYPYTSVWSHQAEPEDGETEGKWYQLDVNGGIHPIHLSGLGCAVFDLKWVEKNVPKPWFLMHQLEHYTEITDDLTFWKAIRAAGGKCLGHGGVQCGHYGNKEFIIDYTKVALQNTHRARVQGQAESFILASPPEPQEKQVEPVVRKVLST